MSDEGSYPNALAAGTRIGAVVLERAIGQGAWGIVYEGRHDTWGRVAVKEYFPASYSMRKASGGLNSTAPQWQDAIRRGLERFGQEGRALRAIRHENVVPVYEYLEDGSQAFLVMDFIAGGTLADALAAGRFRDPSAVMAFAATLIDTLQAIHAKNILHRDIAPDNIIVRPDGSPVLIDFGGAAAAIASATRSTHNIVKDGYSPPEQYDTSANPTYPVGPWSDIYATAAVLYRMASGREPAVANTRLLSAGARGDADPLQPLRQIAPAGYPPTWLAAVDAALALLPKERPQTAAAWRDLFAARPVTTAPSTWRNRVLIIAAIFFGCGGIAFGFLRGGTPTAIAIATPSPRPNNTPRPMPRPTHHPTPRPTHKPTPKPTPRPTLTASPRPAPSPTPRIVYVPIPATHRPTLPAGASGVLSTPGADAIVGSWLSTNSHATTEYGLSFNSDGTFFGVLSTGRWSWSGGQMYRLQLSDAGIITATISHNGTTLITDHDAFIYRKVGNP